MGNGVRGAEHAAAKAQTAVLEQVLLVDDNPINLQILQKTLSHSGYRLLLAHDGETALAMARLHLPSLILLDIMMPDMDGYQVCQALKADPLTENIAIIFLSALEDSSAKVRGFSVGGVDYIAKPFQADEVVARVRNHIKIHRLERELARRNVELETENLQILNAVSEGIIGLDRDGRVTTLNPAAAVITGWPAADALGERLAAMDLFRLDDEEPAEQDSLPYRSYQLGQSCHSEMELIRRRDGRLLPVSLSCTPRVEGGAVVVLRDISEWVDSEEALRHAREELESQRRHMAHMERLSTTGEMAAGIAHEVNQPLTAVANYARVAQRLLQQEPLDIERLQELMGKLDIQSVRASEVIQRLRGYVKKPELGRRTMDPNTMINEVIALADVDSRLNDVTVHFDPEQDLPTITVDVVQIQQVALNLIRNAMEATAACGRHDHSVLVKTSRRQRRVLVEVIDWGEGVPDELETKLFDPFFSTKPKGMGVGLSICQSIIQAHGGEIGYHNNPQGGAVFYFLLPADE